MDCETCHDLLLDLAYGDLDEVRAAAARKHSEGCGDCRESLRKLTRGRALAGKLQLEPAPAPSPALLAAIESAARAATGVESSVETTEARAPQATPPLAESDGAATSSDALGHARPGRAVSRWLERVGEIAMRRQVAMAAVFLLTIGVGLVFYQTHPRPADAPDDDRAPDVVPAEEVPGSPAARTAEGHAPVPRGAGSVSPLRPGAERDDRLRAAPALAHAPAAEPSSERLSAAHVAPAPAPARADELANANAEAQGSAQNFAAPALTNAAVPAGVGRSNSTNALNGGGYAQQAQPTQAQAQLQQNAAPAAAAPTATAPAPAPAGADRASLDANIRQLREAIASASEPGARYRYRSQLADLYRRAGDVAAADRVDAENRAAVETGAVAAPPAAASAAPVTPTAASANQGAYGSNSDSAGASLQLRSRRAAPHTARPAGRRSVAPSNADAYMPAERTGRE